MTGITSQKTRFNTYTNGVDGKGVSIKGTAYCRDTISAESIGKTYIIYSDDTFTTQVINPENDAAYIVQGYLFVYTGKDNKFMCAGLIQGPNGEDGRGVGIIVNYYMASSRSTGVVSGDEGETEDEKWTPEIQTTDINKPYLWNYEVTIYTNGDQGSTEATIIGNYSKDGRGIIEVQEFYCITLSTTQQKDVEVPTDDELDEIVANDEQPPNQPHLAKSNWYKYSPTTDTIYSRLWNLERIIYTTGETEIHEPALMGTHGTDGKGVSMDTIYLKHSVDNPSGVMRPSGDNPEGWSEDIPSFDENKRDERFIFMSQRIIDGDKKGEWSTPKLYTYYNEDGTRVSDTIVNMTNTFNELTRNGEVKGIQQVGNELYLNADYIKTGVLKVGKTVTDENGNEKTLSALEAYLDGENKGEVRLAGWSVDQSMLLSPDRNVALISDDSVTIDGKAVRFWASNSIVNAKGWKILYTYLDDRDEDGERDYELTLSINNDQETTIEITAEYQKEKSHTIFSTTRPVISAIQRNSANPNVSNISGDYWTGGGDSYQQQELRITIEEAPTIIDQGTYICSDGSLYATNAHIQGEIEAKRGSIGSWNINSEQNLMIPSYNNAYLSSKIEGASAGKVIFSSTLNPLSGFEWIVIDKESNNDKAKYGLKFVMSDIPSFKVFSSEQDYVLLQDNFITLSETGYGRVTISLYTINGNKRLVARLNGRNDVVLAEWPTEKETVTYMFIEQTSTPKFELTKNAMQDYSGEAEIEYKERNIIYRTIREVEIKSGSNKVNIKGYWDQGCLPISLTF